MALPAPWTVRWLKDVFLYGLDLTDDRNRPYPDALFVQAMAAGAAWGANHLDIDVFRRTITGERFDLNRAAAGEWMMTRLDRRPIARIRKIQFLVGSTAMPFNVPDSWILFPECDMDGGVVFMVPNVTDLQSLSGMAYSVLAAQSWTQFGKLPGFFSFDYDVGFDVPFELLADTTLHAWTPRKGQWVNGRICLRILTQTAGASRTLHVAGTSLAGHAVAEDVVVPSAGQAWTVNGYSAITGITWTTCDGDAILITGNVPDDSNAADYREIDADVLDLIGKVAAMYALNPAGDMIGGAGIASKSQSVAGASQSINTTSSPMNAGYSARIIQYRKDVTKDAPLVRRRFHGMPVGFI